MSKNEANVSPNVLQELLFLDPKTGAMYWKERDIKFFSNTSRTALHACKNWNSRFANKEAFFTKNRHGYYQGFVLGRIFSAARVVYAIKNGKWPENHIDHINGVKTDNRPTNLRDVSRIDNMRNRALSKNNKTGHHGVSFNAGKYDSYITIDGIKKHLGRFDEIDDAISERRKAEIENNYHINHGR